MTILEKGNRAVNRDNGLAMTTEESTSLILRSLQDTVMGLLLMKRMIFAKEPMNGPEWPRFFRKQDERGSVEKVSTKGVTRQ